MSWIRLPSALLALGLFLLVVPASAETRVSYEDTQLINKSPEQVLAALLDYGNWCEKGCKYFSPGVVVDKKIAPRQGRNHFYTWTWIRDIKDTKYFSEVTVKKKGKRSIIECRALTQGEKARIEEFEAKTGHVHNALFDTSSNWIELWPVVDESGKPKGTQVRFRTVVTVSGFLALFPKKLRAGLEESTQAVFRALRG